MINTTLCYIEQNDKYLLLHRVKKKNDINKDKWIGIGGKFEEWESPEDCIRREALEETGLTLIRPKYRGIVTFISDGMDETEFMHLFTATEFAGSLKDCDEGVLEWVDKYRTIVGYRIFNSLPCWVKYGILILFIRSIEIKYLCTFICYSPANLVISSSCIGKAWQCIRPYKGFIRCIPQ